MQIPLELQDHIIDYLSTGKDSDRPILSRCGLVCKSWLASTRLHLLSCVDLDDTDWEKFNVALQMICADHSTLRFYIRHLVICVAQGPGILVTLPPSFPVLKCLSLAFMQFESPSRLGSSEIVRLQGLSNSLTRLELIYVEVSVCFPYDGVDAYSVILYISLIR